MLNTQNSFIFARQRCISRFRRLGLKGNQVKILDSPAAVSSYTFSIIFATVPDHRNGKAFGKGNKSEDLPLRNYSTLSGKRRRIKPDLFYSSSLFPQQWIN